MAKSRGKKIPATPADQVAVKKVGEKGERSSSRERKQVERYFEPYPVRVSGPKNPTIEQGPGEKLGDIPNVHFKMSKRKTDDNLNVLHTILFGRKSNVKYVKRNILQFSGFVWADNEEKQKAKVKEKLEKCTKEKLLDFCEIFDMPVNKSVIRKEEASNKLLEFLESPYVSRDVVLEEKEKENKKRKRAKEVTQTTSREATPDREQIKKSKVLKSDKIERGQSAKSNKDDEDVGDSCAFEKNDHVKSKPLSKKKISEKSIIAGGSKIKQIASFSNEVSSTKSNKNSSKLNPKPCTASQDDSNVPARSKKVSPNKPTRKGSKSVAKEKPGHSEKDSEEASERVLKSAKKSASKDGTDLAPHSTNTSLKVDNKKGHSNDKLSTEASKKKTTKPKLSLKEKGKRRAQDKAVKGPSREDMLPVVTEILKEVDFEVVTLADILKQLELHFNVSLKDKKEEVKSVIEEAINTMSDLEDSEDDEGNTAKAESADNRKGSDDGHKADTEDPEKEELEDEEGADMGSVAAAKGADGNKGSGNNLEADADHDNKKDPDEKDAKEGSDNGDSE